MSEVTRLLQSINDGDSHASEELLPLVYNELRVLAAARMKSERADHTLQPTALVHEAYLKLVDVPNPQTWENRGHFFAAAAEAMRRILIDASRKRHSLKRGGAWHRMSLEDLAVGEADSAEMLLDVDEALTRFAKVDSKAAELVKLRLFAGLSVTEAGEALGWSRSIAYDNWSWAKAWINRFLNQADDPRRTEKD
jgi:RNA polymerase sigma factor (TIGR02999 family)